MLTQRAKPSWSEMFSGGSLVGPSSKLLKQTALKETVRCLSEAGLIHQ